MSTIRPARRTALAFAAALALLAAGCGSSAEPDTATAASTASASGPVTITDSQGRTVSVPLNPDVVVATDWSVIRTLADLGIEVDAVPAAIGTLPEDLKAYTEGVQTVGDVFEPDYEAIAALEPDLVVVGSRSGTPEVIAEFEKFAPAVLDMSVRSDDPSKSFALNQERVEQLGSIFGKEAEATALMDGIAADIAEVRTQVEAGARSAMVVQVSDGTVSAYGPGSRFGTVYADFGYQPTAAPLDGEGSHGEEISQEFFVQYNPGVIFVLDRAKAIGQAQAPALDVLDNALVGSTDAAKGDRIAEIDGFSWYLAASAPSSWQRMVEDVRGAL